jgi:hypothetical protein
MAKIWRMEMMEEDGLLETVDRYSDGCRIRQGKVRYLR